MFYFHLVRRGNAGLDQDFAQAAGAAPGTGLFERQTCGGDGVAEDGIGRDAEGFGFLAVNDGQFGHTLKGSPW
jgi:hypothetical protein